MTFDINVILIGIFVYTIGLIVLNVAFAIADANGRRELRKRSDKMVAAYALVYLVERLHRRRFEETREHLHSMQHTNRLNRARLNARRKTPPSP